MTEHDIKTQAYLYNMAPDISVFSLLEKFYYQNYQTNDWNNGLFYVNAVDNNKDAGKNIYTTKIRRGFFMFRDESIKSEPGTETTKVPQIEKLENSDLTFYIIDNYSIENCYFVVMISDNYIEFSLNNSGSEYSVWGVAF